MPSPSDHLRDEALREKHRQHIHRAGCHRWFDHDADELLDLIGPAGWCDRCAEDWPCDTTKALNRAAIGEDALRIDVPIAPTLDVETQLEGLREVLANDIETLPIMESVGDDGERLISLEAVLEIVRGASVSVDRESE